MNQLPPILAGATATLIGMTGPVFADEQPIAKGSKVAYQVYKSYFESNKSGLEGDRSFLAFTDQKAFDKVFGKAVVMGKKPKFLPKDAFDTKLVIAAIRRGHKVWEYGVDKVTADGKTLYVQYEAHSGAEDSATFASPLIISVGKAKYSTVVFIENGKKVGSATIGSGE
ncbi:MAG TPA: hypothetical protein VK395_37735 [Gemmataceae bacterium]|nr:hypothetical protein [Gemmataceae bacterium]